MRKAFVQVGATRDGREGYMEAARRRGMETVLVETPAYLVLRRAAGRRDFDACIGLESPADPEAIARELKRLQVSARLMLAGFERYTASVQQTARRAGLPHGGWEFSPPSKLEQRRMLARNAPQILQPGFRRISPESVGTLEGLRYPAVLKPVDGAGGLGVMQVRDPEQLAGALRHAAGLRNYDNNELRDWIAEEYIEAPEWSVQGICRAGECHVLSLCSKIIACEPLQELPRAAGFREIAHIAMGRARIPDSVLRFAADCAAAFAYRDGPFHIDFRWRADGPVFIEMGFRLSGGAVTDLVREVSGIDWAEAVFATMLDENVPGEAGTSRPNAPPLSVAHVLAFSERQVKAAVSSAGGHEIRIEPIRSAACALPPEIARALTADLSRHTGPVARIQIRGRDFEAVRALAQALSGSQSAEMENNNERVELSNVSGN